MLLLDFLFFTKTITNIIIIKNSKIINVNLKFLLFDIFSSKVELSSIESITKLYLFSSNKFSPLIFIFTDPTIWFSRLSWYILILLDERTGYMLNNYIDNLKDEIVSKTQELIQIPSVYSSSSSTTMPFGKEANNAL